MFYGLVSSFGTFSRPKPPLNRLVKLTTGTATIRKSERMAKSVFVRNLPRGINETALEDYMSNAGSVWEVKLTRDMHGRRCCTAAVMFASPREAQEAIKMFHMRTFMGRPLLVDHDHEDNFAPVLVGVDSGAKHIKLDLARTHSLGRKVVVHNVHRNANPAVFEKMMSKAGEVLSVQIPQKGEKGVTGMWVVEFVSTAAARDAIKMFHGAHFRGKELSVYQYAPLPRTVRVDKQQEEEAASEARGSVPERSKRRLVFSRLPHEVTKSNFRKYLEQYYPVRSVRLLETKMTTEGPMLLVTFATEQAARDAHAKFDGFAYGEVKMKVRWDAKRTVYKSPAQVRRRRMAKEMEDSGTEDEGNSSTDDTDQSSTDSDNDSILDTSGKQNASLQEDSGNPRNPRNPGNSGRRSSDAATDGVALCS